MTTQTRSDPAKLYGLIKERFENLRDLHTRMDEDYRLWRLDNFVPDMAEGIAEADAYTTNRPRVLANKVISFLSSTELVVRVPDEQVQDRNVRKANDALEALVIGMLKSADKLLRATTDHQSLQDSLSWFATVRGWKVAARGLLRKKESGETCVDIVPLDPRHVFVQKGEEEPLWAVHRTFTTRGKIRDRFKGFKFHDEDGRTDDDDESEILYDYYFRVANPDFDPGGLDAFSRHPWRYMNGVLIDDQWAMKPVDRFCLAFPIVAISVDQMPSIAVEKISRRDDVSDDHSSLRDQGESVFADNRGIWTKKSRAMSYLMDMMAKQSDPPKILKSIDGTSDLGDNASEKGGTVPLDVSRQEELELMEQPDLARAGLALLQEINTDETAGGLAPQGLGIVDTPLSSVALRQLGINIEHKITPRLKAIEMCIEGVLENIVAQYETGGFEPIRVSGRRYNGTAFSQIVLPEDLEGHDPLEISLKFQPPEDETIRWNIANMAAQLTPAGEPLASLPYIRTRILNMQSSDIISEQNATALARASSPVAQAWDRYQAALKTNDPALIAITLDAVKLAALQHNIQVNAGIVQLLTAMQGLPVQAASFGSPEGILSLPNGSEPQRQFAQNGQSRNPGYGAPPAVLSTGVGNQPSPEAGFNTTAPRQSEQTGLVGPDGQPIGA